VRDISVRGWEAEMGICNYCILKSIKKEAQKAGFKVTVLHDAVWGFGGVNVYIHPKDVNIRKLPGGEDGERAQYRSAWMMEIGSRCEC
jgi:hypothetical protein